MKKTSSKTRPGNAPVPTQLYRQGDVALLLVDAIPEGAKPSDSGNPILAHGEVTGHHHQMLSLDACLFESRGERYLDLPTVADLHHQEHAPIAHPAGKYRVLQQREYHPEEVRRVVD